MRIASLLTAARFFHSMVYGKIPIDVIIATSVGILPFYNRYR